MGAPQDEGADAPRHPPVARVPGLSAAIGPGTWLALSVQARHTSAAIGTRGRLGARARDDELPAEVEQVEQAAQVSQSRVAGHSSLPRAGDRGPRASRAALRVVELVLDRANLTIADLEGLCVANGPGAFTALRVAISVVQGIGIARRLPVIAVPSLAALAVAAVAGSGASRSLVLTAIDARMGQCYFGAWLVTESPLATSDSLPLPLPTRPIAVIAGAVGDGGAAVAAFEAALAAHGPQVSAVVLAGSAFAIDPALQRWRPAVAAPARPPRLRAELEVEAADVLRAALADPLPEAAATNDWGPMPASALRPLYLRDKVALDIDEQQSLARARYASSSSP